jgi:hypothetical protein
VPVLAQKGCVGKKIRLQAIFFRIIPFASHGSDLRSSDAMDSDAKEKPRRTGAGFSIPAAAEAIGVSPKTLRSAIAQRQVRVIDFGGLPRVPKAEVERLKEVFEQ